MVYIYISWCNYYHHIYIYIYIYACVCSIRMTVYVERDVQIKESCSFKQFVRYLKITLYTYIYYTIHFKVDCLCSIIYNISMYIWVCYILFYLQSINISWKIHTSLYNWLLLIVVKPEKDSHLMVAIVWVSFRPTESSQILQIPPHPIQLLVHLTTSSNTNSTTIKKKSYWTLLTPVLPQIW